MRKPTSDCVTYRFANDLGGLGQLDASFHQQRFPLHVHESYCVGVIDKGAERFYLEGSQHVAPAGSIILVNPDQIHDGHCATGLGWSYRSIYPTEGMLSDVTCDLQGLGSVLPWFSDPVIFDPVMATKLRQLFELLRDSSNHLERQTHYLDVMTQLIQRHGGSSRSPVTLKAHPLAVQQVRDYLDAHCCENVSLKQLAQMVQLNPQYLTRLFRRTVGAPPHAYQLMRRIQRAKELIQSGTSLADTATNTGFTDQSHLHRHFKKMMGVTPGQYLAATR